MKRSFLLLCAVLLVLGCALPCAAYRLARMTLAQSTAVRSRSILCRFGRRQRSGHLPC